MSKRILIIDDDAAVRVTLLHLLRGVGYDVTFASDGLEGLRVFHAFHPHLVITDIIMPEQEGIETILAIKREEPAVRIIAMSGGGRIGNVDFLKMAELLGADDVIDKPFGLDQITEMVERSLVA